MFGEENQKNIDTEKISDFHKGTHHNFRRRFLPSERHVSLSYHPTRNSRDRHKSAWRKPSLSLGNCRASEASFPEKITTRAGCRSSMAARSVHGGRAETAADPRARSALVPRAEKHPPRSPFPAMCAQEGPKHSKSGALQWG